jgi:zinc transporter ZupT
MMITVLLFCAYAVVGFAVAVAVCVAFIAYMHEERQRWWSNPRIDADDWAIAALVGFSAGAMWPATAVLVAVVAVARRVMYGPKRERQAQ